MEVSPGYKQTEIGAIPIDWELVSLVDLIDESRSIRYGIVQPGKHDPTGRYMIRGQDYSKGWVSSSEIFKVSSQVEEPFKNARVKAGDIVITIVGASTGHIEVIPEWLEGANLTQTTARIAVNPSKAFSGYCKCYLQSTSGQNQVTSYLKGAAQPGLNCGDIEKFKVPLPPSFLEQCAIATALSDVDALLAGLDRLIAKKRDLKQAAMQQLLTGQIRLPGFRGEWATVTMRQVLSQKATYGIVTSGAFVHTGAKMLRSGDIFDGHLNTDLPMVTLEKAAEYSRTSLAKDDIVIALVGYPGAAAKVPDELIGANISRAVGLLRTNGSVSVDFLVCFLNSPDGRKMVLAPSAGSAQLVVNLSALNLLQFSIPPLREQVAIASVVSEMESEIFALEQRRDKTRALKQAMMQELLTGRTRLVETPTPIPA